MSDDEMFAEIELICASNALLLGEEQVVWPRRRTDGTVRVQERRNGRWVRGRYRHYTSMASALGAAQEAHQNAKRIARSRRAA